MSTVVTSATASVSVGVVIAFRHVVARISVTYQNMH